MVFILLLSYLHHFPLFIADIFTLCLLGAVKIFQVKQNFSGWYQAEFSYLYAKNSSPHIFFYYFFPERIEYKTTRTKGKSRYFVFFFVTIQNRLPYKQDNARDSGQATQ